MNKTLHFYLKLIFLVLLACLWGTPAPATEEEESFGMINEARTMARTGNYSAALDKLQEAIVLADENEERLALAIAYNNVAEIHRLQGNNIEALESYSQALQVYHELGHRNGIASTGRKIDKILGRPTRAKTTETRQAIQEPETVQKTEIVETPQTVEAAPSPLPFAVPEKLPSEKRDRLIEEAIKRVRSRVKSRQTTQGPTEPVTPQIPESVVQPPKEPPEQNTKLETPPITKPTDYSGYLEQVKENIVRAWQYPEQASEQREEGKVDVEFTILKDGRLLDVRILQSSGYSALDREAIRAVGAASPFDPIPEQIALEQISIRFSFNYTLEKQRDSR